MCRAEGQEKSADPIEQRTIMKSLGNITGSLLFSAVLTFSVLAFAAEQEPQVAQKTAKLKPYSLKTCLVSDEKLGGDMGEPFVYKYKDREIKFCCKGCQKDFDKDPAKHIKKLETAEKAAKGSKPANAAPEHSAHQH